MGSNTKEVEIKEAVKETGRDGSREKQKKYNQKKIETKEGTKSSLVFDSSRSAVSRRSPHRK